MHKASDITNNQENNVTKIMTSSLYGDFNKEPISLREDDAHCVLIRQPEPPISLTDLLDTTKKQAESIATLQEQVATLQKEVDNLKSAFVYPRAYEQYLGM